MYLFASWSSNHTKCQLNCHCITIKILFQDKAKEKKKQEKKEEFPDDQATFVDNTQLQIALSHGILFRL